MKLIVIFRDPYKIEFDKHVIAKFKNPKEGNTVVEKESVTRRLFGNGPEE